MLKILTIICAIFLIDPSHGVSHPEPHSEYSNVNDWAITTPTGPGDVLIPGLQNLGECKDTINRCLTDINAQGLYNFYYINVDTTENIIYKLDQALFTNCVGDLNCRTCTIQVLDMAPPRLTNIFYNLNSDLWNTITAMHLGNAPNDVILPYINATVVKNLVIAVNRWCPE